MLPHWARGGAARTRPRTLPPSRAFPYREPLLPPPPWRVGCVRREWSRGSRLDRVCLVSGVRVDGVSCVGGGVALGPPHPPLSGGLVYVCGVSVLSYKICKLWGPWHAIARRDVAP